MSKRRKFGSALKAKVVLEALRERYSIQELGRKYEVHPNQITKWKTQFLENAESVFEVSGTSSRRSEGVEDKLYKVIGQLKVENDFLKKALL